MKICVTSEDKMLDSRVDPRFGRCKYFLFVETDSLEFEAVENPNIDAAGGAGIQAGQLMASKNVRAVLTGNVGPNAFDTLKAAGIEVITGLSGTVKEAVEKYKAGELRVEKGPTVDQRFGMDRQ